MVTPTPPSAVPADPAVGLPKLIPSTQPKISASPAASDGGQGLTQPQIGGIVGGAVVLLLAILAATWIIVRKLNHTAKVVESSKQGGSSSGGGLASKPTTHRGMRPTPSQVDQMEYDDLLQGPVPAAGRSRSASELSSANATPFPSSTSDARLTASMETARGYFDVPERVQNMPGRHSLSTSQRTSMDSHANQQGGHWQQLYYKQHGRHYSASSQASDGSGGGGGGGPASGVGSPLLPAELGTEGGFFPELPTPPLEQARRRSGSNGAAAAAAMMTATRPSPAHARRRSDGPSGAGQPLSVVSESVEHLMHGHYGPQNAVAGQTRAGAYPQLDISSPIAPGYNAQLPPFPDPTQPRDP